MNDNDNRKWLYETLKSSGYNMGSYDEFNNAMDNDENTRRWCYDQAVGKGINMGSYDEYTSAMRGVQQPTPAAPTAAQQPAGGAIGSVQRAVENIRAAVPQRDMEMNKEKKPRTATAAGGNAPGVAGKVLSTAKSITNQKPSFEDAVAEMRKRTAAADAQMPTNPITGDHMGEINPLTYNHAANMSENEEAMAKAQAAERMMREEEHHQRNMEKPLEDAMRVLTQSETAVGKAWQDADVAAANESEPRVSYTNVPEQVGNMIGNAIRSEAAHLKHHDIDKLREEAWNNIPQEVKQHAISRVAQVLRKEYGDGISYGKSVEYAEKLVRGRSDKMMYDYAVKQNAPNGWLDYLTRKINENAIGSILEGIARNEAGTVGDMLAREEAEQKYAEDNWFGGLSADVLKIGLAPEMHLFGGIGGATAKGGMGVASRVLGKEAARGFEESMGGNILRSALSSGGNFAAFEAAGEAENQFRHGGKVDIDENGEMKVGDYNLGDMLKAGLHGFVLGGSTGVVSPVVNNIGDKLVARTASTAGKLGAKGAKTLMSIAAEGTVFSLEDFINGHGDIDTWLESVGTMAGFKASHGLKSALGTYEALKARPESRAGFETRLRELLDRRPEYGLTKDEKHELEMKGYSDLADLVYYYERTPEEQRKAIEERRPVNSELQETLGERGVESVPYNRFIELMEDKSISEAARAKMHYLVTGHRLPQSMVVATEIRPETDNGKVIGYTVESRGSDNGVITSRMFSSEKEAKVEKERLDRQAELNGVAKCEDIYNYIGDQQRLRDAYDIVAQWKHIPGENAGEVLRRMLERDPKTLSPLEKEWLDDVQKAMAELPREEYQKVEKLRAEIDKEYGVKIDDVISKERNRRSDKEQKALKEYVRRMIGEAEESGVMEATDGSTTEPPADQKLLKGGYSKGYDADEQGRKDIALELSIDPDNESKREEWRGVQQRISDDADMMAAEQREEAKKKQFRGEGENKGTLRPVKITQQNGEPREVFLTQGEIALTESGLVDPEKTKELNNVGTLTGYDPATGEEVQFTPADIVEVEPMTTAEQQEQNIEANKQAYIQQQMDAATPTATTTDPKATTSATTADNQQQEPAPAKTKGKPKEFVPGMTLTVTDREGNEHTVTTDGERYTYNPVTGELTESENGNYLKLTDKNGDVLSYDLSNRGLGSAQEIKDYEMPKEEQKDAWDEYWKKNGIPFNEEQPTETVEPTEQPTAEVPTAEGITPQQQVTPESTPEPAPVEKADPMKAPMPMKTVGRGENKHEEEDWMATTPERAYTYLYEEAVGLGLPVKTVDNIVANNLKKAQDKVKRAETATGSIVGVLQKQNAAKAEVEYWEKVQKLRSQAMLAAAEAEAERTKEQRAAEAQRAAERREQRRNTEVGEAGSTPAEKYNSSNKIVGNKVSRTIADKTKIKGHYVLVEADALTPSHDPFNGWKVSEGFPTTEDGKSVNDRVYEGDKEAQDFTESIAQVYDGQAVSEIPVVSSEGIVYDGNGRTMAGQIAARNNTDGEYIEALMENAANFGFTEEQVQSMSHPRVVMQVDEDMPYNATTFARFNKDSKKKMNNVNKAVSIGKQMTDSARDAMLEIIDRYGTIDTFFGSEVAAADVVNMLVDGGFITQQEVPAFREKNSEGKMLLSADGRSFVTNTLLGTLFDEEAIRKLGNDKGLQNSLLRAIPQIAENRRLGEYALTDEINTTIDLLYEARKSGMTFDLFKRQGNLVEGLVEDRYEPMVVIMADLMSSGVDNFREFLTLYNQSAAADAASGGENLFGRRTKEDLKNAAVEYYKAQRNGQSDNTQAAAADTGRNENAETQPGVGGIQESEGDRGTAAEQPAGEVDNLINEIVAADEKERAAAGKPEYNEAYNEKAALADRVLQAASSLSQEDLLKIQKVASERGMHAVAAHVENELMRRGQQPAGEVAEAKWDEHRKQVLDTYDKEYERIEKADGERLRNEARGYSDERLLNTYINDTHIANIFGKGREGISEFVGTYDKYKAPSFERTEDTDKRISDAQQNHIEAAEDAARQSFVIDVLKAELDRRGIEYKDDYNLEEFGTAADWLKANQEEQPKQQKTGGNATKTSKRDRGLLEVVMDKLRNIIGDRLHTTLTEDEKRMINWANAKTKGTAPVFYSNAEKAVEGIRQEKATAEQWLAMIQKAGGLKAGEDKWMGLSDWLNDHKGKSLTKQEVLDFIRDNQIQMQEVNYGDALFSPNSKVNFESDIERARENGESDESVMEAWDREFDTKMVEAYKNGEFTIDENGKVVYDGQLMMPINDTRRRYTTDFLKNKREIAFVIPNVESWNRYDDVHFGDAGEGRAVMWVRFGETTDKDGKKVLVIDEIQSNRHQEGREKGYRKESTSELIKKQGELERRRIDMVREFQKNHPDDVNNEAWDAFVNSKEYKDILKEESETEDKIRASYNLIPDAPFEKNWHEVAMKRMLRYAAENGYDKVAWTKGEQQAERYQLGSYIKELKAEESYKDDAYKDIYADGSHIASVDKDGIILGGENEGKPLSELIGKELAAQVMKKGDVTLSGKELFIGGEGMKGFYDQILPRFMDKYGKKWGVKTTDVELPNVGDNGLTMHSVEVTPEMKKSVLEGQPMFHKVFHGSGADFERFDSSHMGEGEGAQAYGYGHYTTEVEGIGRTYAESLGKNLVRYIGKEYMPLYLQKTVERMLSSGRKLDDIKQSIAKTRDMYNDDYKNYPDHEKEERTRRYNEAVKYLENVTDKDFVEDGGHYLYTVDIPDDNGSNYIDWTKKPGVRMIRRVVDKMTDEQKERIASVPVQRYFDGTETIPKDDLVRRIQYHLNNNGWNNLYDVAVVACGSKTPANEKAASELLHSAGFTGIKYPAQYRSGGREDNAKNYVIFDDGDLKITDKIKFFKTPQGEVYGFTVGGNIYVDMDIAKADTPIHEYGHLWVPMVRESDPEMWEDIKRVLTKDKDVKPFMDIVRQRYPELTAEGREDDFMEEVFTHFSGDNGLKMLEEAAREYEEQDGQGIISKAKAIAALNKVKEALDKFWGKVAQLFGIKFRNAREVANKMFKDFMDEVDPTARARAEQKERDKEYMEAVEKGDIEKAQRMVIEAFMEAYPNTKIVDKNGSPMVVYHETDGNFTAFDTKRSNYDGLIFFSNTPSRKGLEYGGNRMACFLNVTNPKVTETTIYERAVDYDKRKYDGGINIFTKRFGKNNELEDTDGMVVAVKDPSQIKSADPVTYDDNGNVIPLSKRFNSRNADIRFQKADNKSTERESDGTLFRSLNPESDEVVDNAEVGTKPLSDREKVAKLEAEPKVKVYRSMQLIDGKLYPPMSAKVDGQLREPSELGVWEEADEAPDMADENGKFKLDKGNRKSLKAAYNPYIHTSRTMLNDQFSEAQDRPNLVVVEMEVPESELTSDYKAEKAKDSVGAKQWKAGVIQGQLSGTREVILSRWAKPVRIVPTEEVADNIAKQIEGQVAVMPSNVVTPEVREALEARGVKFVETDNTGKIKEGPNKGKTWAQVYGKKAPKGREADSLYVFNPYTPYSSYEESLEASKAAGYSKRQHDAMVERRKKNYAERGQRAKDFAEKLNLGDRVVILENADGLEERFQDKKGWYNPRTGKITIVLDKHGSMDDILQTILHEGVGHHGLRAMFGKEFDNFLDNVYAGAEIDVRKRIIDLAKNHGWDFRTATEEYLSQMAETMDFEKPENKSWWQKVKKFFLDMLHKLGIKGAFAEGDNVISDNELSYLLWRSYQNLVNPGRYRSFVDTANDVVMQDKLKVGNYEETSGDRGAWYEPAKAAEPGIDLDEVATIEAEPEMDGFVSGLGIRMTMTDGNTYNLWVQTGDDDGMQGVTEFYGNNDDGVPDEEATDRFGKFFGEDVNTIFGSRIGNLLMSPRTQRNGITLSRDEIKQYAKAAEPSAVAEGDGAMFREGDVPRAQARDAYERMMAQGANQFKEAVQDSMLSLKKLYEAILGKGTKIEDVEGYKNAYLAENRMHSASQAEIGMWHKDFMEPVVKAIHELTGGKRAAYDDLVKYMMAKHGLERNAVFAERDAQAAAKKGADYDDELQKNRGRDYAGLTALTGEDDVANAEGMAQKMVDDYEADHDTTELWNAINRATKQSLWKLASSGMMTPERYNEIRDMFSYYIPLQGFDETVAENVYSYMGNDGTIGYGTPIRHARGRKSLADDPIATMAMNGEAAIRQANRNEMKKRFLAFAQEHPSDLVSVSEVWLKHNDVTGEWEQVTADLNENDSPADVERKTREFDEKMEQLSSNDPDHYKKASDIPNVPFRVVEPSDMKQHQVLVQRGGKKYMLTINGNPRAAQALNGLTNPDVFTEGVFGKAMNLGQWLNRQLSAFYTTRNPEFVLSNFLRDAIYSNSMSWVKESPNYALKFHKNFGKMNPVHMGKLFAQWENGKLRERIKNGTASETDQLFYDFMTNGGETGWTSLRDIEKHKKELQSSLKREGSTSRKAWKALGEAFDLMNRSAENCVRFAAFVTSREMGRSIDRSISDAKEVSVNFNKKGAGDKFLTAKNQNLLGKVGASMGGLGRGLYVFFNASMQGLNNIARATKRHPGKAAGVYSTLFALGALAPILAEVLSGGDDDDDKNAYYNLPEYIRRSNICFRFGKDMPWITIPLPIEFRAIYGLGELSTGALTGKEHYTDEEFAKQYVSQLSQVLPLDFMEGGGGWHAFVPSMIKPYVEAQSNTSWTGLPIYRDNTFKPYDPEWTRAYSSANKQLVDATKWLNEATGGDDVTKGFIDWNPAKIEYMLKGYLGGYFTMYDRLQKTAETALGNRDFEWRNIPMASRVLREGDERTEARKLTNEYFDLVDEYNDTKHKVKEYEKISKSDREDAIKYAQKLAYLNNSEEYTRYLLMEYYKPILDQFHDMVKEADGEQSKRIKGEENSLRRELINIIHSIDDGAEIDVDAAIDEMLMGILNDEQSDISLRKKAQNTIKKHRKAMAASQQ